MITSRTTEVLNNPDIASIRSEFPILDQSVNGYPLVYLDNAATTQKPQVVIDAINHYYTRQNANIHRGAHYLAHISTVAFENVRDQIKNFLNSSEREEIIFTSGTTDSINLVAQTWGRKNLHAGDEIVLSMMEHHSNIVPWQMIAEEKGAVIKVIPITATGEWDLEVLESIITAKTKLVAVNHVSNALGTINPVEKIITKAHSCGALVLLDGAQAVSHFAVDVQKLDCDFYCFSGHKLYGPTGIGVLYGKKELLNAMPPYRGGGEMIKSVSFEGTTYNELPHKFEAGTPHIEGVIGLGAALQFVTSLPKGFAANHEMQLLDYATKKLNEIPGIKIFGTSAHKVSVISFLVNNIHPYDMGTLLDKQGVAVRTGHHCTEPLWNYFKVPGSVRASFAIYNTCDEVDMFISALNKSIRLLQK